MKRRTRRRLSVEWVLDDMRRFHRPAAFDLACNLFTSFGYFEHEEDNLRVLRNIWQSLRDGGTLVMDMVGKERVVRQGLNEQRTEFADGVVLIQQPRVNQDWTRMHLEWTVARPVGESRTYRFEHHLYSGSGLAGSSVELRLLHAFASTAIYKARPTVPTQRA